MCSSLTKIFSGRGDVLAGSLIINSHTHIDSTSSSPPPSDKRAARARQLVDIAGSLDLPALYLADAVTLERNSRDFLQRCALVNQTGRALAEWLRDQRGVGDLFYSAGEEYESVMRNKGMAGERVSGYGCLMSLVLLPEWDEKTFFDCLAVAKGPSLGTNFTIACPYTLLAHYLELDWANQYGVDRRLIRISVGLENLDVSGHFGRSASQSINQYVCQSVSQSMCERVSHLALQLRGWKDTTPNLFLLSFLYICSPSLPFLHLSSPSSILFFICISL